MRLCVDSWFRPARAGLEEGVGDEGRGEGLYLE